MDLVIGVASLVATAVGAGVSYSAQKSAAASQGQMALLNAQAQTQALRQQGKVATMQGMINAQLAESERAAANANARALEAQAQTGTRQAQENSRRTREEYARLIALQRAQVAKSGFVDTTGSPLDLLTSSAEAEQAEADQIRYEDEVSRRGLFREAEIMRNEGRLAGISALGALASGAAGRASASAGVSQARLDMYAQRAAASAARSEAFGGLLSSGGGLGLDAYSTFRTTPRGVKLQKPRY